MVLCTDIFDEFMMSNNLYPIALSDASDDEILKHFLHAQLPDSLIADFFTFFEATRSPIAIRSSSLLEDAHYQPFAGIYSTYMIPYLEDKYQMLQMLACAIKGVYASVFYRDSKWLKRNMNFQTSGELLTGIRKNITAVKKKQIKLLQR
jgi:hypothetical protein